MPRGRNAFTRREIMQYIVSHRNRYGETVVERAQRFLDSNGQDDYSPRARQQSRANERNSAARSASRNRTPAGMSSQTTRQAVNRGTGLSRSNVTNEARLRTAADSYAAFGWGK